MVFLMGHAGRPADIRVTKSGTKVASFSIATSDKYGEGSSAKESTDWHNIVVFGWLADSVEKMLKGATVTVLGRLKTRSWDDQKTGMKRYATEIHAETVSIANRPDIAANPRPEESVDSEEEVPF